MGLEVRLAFLERALRLEGISEIGIGKAVRIKCLYSVDLYNKECKTCADGDSARGET